MAGLTVPDPGAHIELRDVSKPFAGARALEAVSLQIPRGSIHALVGENGAGKSTLGKIISGDLAPDHGQLLVDGNLAQFHTPRAALASGIAQIAQELSIVPALSVAENVFLGVEPARVELLPNWSLASASISTAMRARRRCMSVRGLSAAGVTDVSLDVREGEIVGLAGLVGAGRTELARAIFQADRTSAGIVTAAGGRQFGKPVLAGWLEAVSARIGHCAPASR